MQMLVMGVCGTGKTTLGLSLAQALGARFIEGDDFHPASNVSFMTSGQPLDDAMRAPWLLALAEQLANAVRREESVVLACSALKSSYRKQLIAACPELCIIWLYAERAEIVPRILERKDHFMPIELLESQFTDLEPPQDAIAIHVSRPVTELVTEILEKISHANKLSVEK